MRAFIRGVKMAQRNPTAVDQPITPELAREELERLAAEQNVKPISNLDMLRADFWLKMKTLMTLFGSFANAANGFKPPFFGASRQLEQH